nr:unnamed protein product [Callosobruchus chinensis]
MLEVARSASVASLLIERTTLKCKACQNYPSFRLQQGLKSGVIHEGVGVTLVSGVHIILQKYHNVMRHCRLLTSVDVDAITWQKRSSMLLELSGSCPCPDPEPPSLGPESRGRFLFSIAGKSSTLKDLSEMKQGMGKNCEDLDCCVNVLREKYNTEIKILKDEENNFKGMFIQTCTMKAYPEFLGIDGNFRFRI